MDFVWCSYKSVEVLMYFASIPENDSLDNFWGRLTQVRC